MQNTLVLSRRVAFLIAASMIAACVAAPARAHSFLVEATPSAKAVLETSPKLVKLRFGGGVEPKYSKLTVSDEKGKVLKEGANAASEKPRELSLDLPELGPGRYTVRFRVLSTDGHVVEGAYEFTVNLK